MEDISDKTNKNNKISSAKIPISIKNVNNNNNTHFDQQFSNYQYRDLFQVHSQAQNRRLSIKGSQLLSKYVVKKGYYSTWGIQSSNLLKTSFVAVLTLLLLAFSSILFFRIIIPKNTINHNQSLHSKSSLLLQNSSISPNHHQNIDDLQRNFKVYKKLKILKLFQPIF